jgi:anaerobic magnesium-protoporphyrin IX monomethyl ester cyclase
MSQTIDCLFIGHNSVSINEQEKFLKMQGMDNSFQYRHLRMNFLRYQDKAYSITDFFNSFFYGDDPRETRLGPIKFTNTFIGAIAYLGNYLAKRGFCVDFIHSFKDQREELARKLRENQVLSIAISTTFYYDEFPLYEMIQFIKEHNNTAKVILGGPYIRRIIQLTPGEELQKILLTFGADFVVYSPEGEATLKKIVSSLRNSSSDEYLKIDNLYYRDGSEYRFTASSAENNSFEDDIIDWSLFGDHVGSFVNIRTSKSCPFSCSFCTFPEFAGPYKTASVEIVEQILNKVNDIGRVEGIYFIDDTFNVPPNRFKEILRMMIRNKYSFKWNSFFRCQYADREMIELMKESGCEGVFLGIESGSQEILDNMNKSVSVEKYRQGLSLLNEYQILNIASFIIGFPGETFETYQETKDFIEECKPTFYRAAVWVCEPFSSISKNGAQYDLRVNNENWSHRTMDIHLARELEMDLFTSVKNSVWIRNMEYDYTLIFQLLHRGLSLDQVKRFYEWFNLGLREKIEEGNEKEVSREVVEGLRAVGR